MSERTSPILCNAAPRPRHSQMSVLERRHGFARLPMPHHRSVTHESVGTNNPPEVRPGRQILRELASKGHEPLLHHASGTLRFDLRDGTRRRALVRHHGQGDVTVSHRNAKADAVMRIDKKLFEGMAKGTVNLTAALLRGVVEVEGDLGLLSSFDRLFPGPERSRASFLERQEELAG